MTSDRTIRTGMRHPICFAHRGAAAELPENTLPSFARALELGADALETDLHLTRDGVIVVAHDDDGLRMAGVRAKIRESTLAEVRAWDAGYGFVEGGERPFAGKGYRVPTLEELLEAFPNVLLNVDAKQLDPPVVPPLLALLERQGASARVNVASFHRRALRDARRRGYPGTTGLAPLEMGALLSLPRAACRALRRVGRLGDVAQIPPKEGPVVLARRSFVEKLHDVGLVVDFWTINEPEEAEALLALGADGIMTDDPRKIAPVVRRFRERA
jgi:glycerophosphoryl diester phosphodiesterase